VGTIYRTFFTEQPPAIERCEQEQESRAVAGNPRDAAVIFDP